MTDVCVIGLGHIGLPTALTIAASGLHVTGVDLNESLIKNLNAGKNDLIEPGLSELLKSSLADGRYKSRLTPEPSDVYIISVPTPLDSANHPVLDHVLDAAHAIAPHIKLGGIVILESTVPPGTTQSTFTKMLAGHSRLTPGVDFHIAHCPERVLPGTILRELVENDRVVGGTTPEASSRAAEFYRRFVTGEVLETNSVTAELVKLGENIYRDVNIGLANEFAMVSEKLGANVWDVIELANKHPRVNIHQPGPGVGGYCIPVAPWMLSADLDENNSLILQARQINAGQPSIMVATVLSLLGDAPNPKVAVLGAAYKGDVGDARATPTQEIIDSLIHAGVSVNVHDPLTKEFTVPLDSLEDTFRDADIALVLTGHSEYKNIDPEMAARSMKTLTIVDTRNVLVANIWEQAGFDIVRLGVGNNNDHSIS